MTERTTQPPTGTETSPPDHHRTSRAYVPRVGDLVWDAAVRKVGRVMDRIGTRWQLRPVGGGLEWDTEGPLRPATAPERLSAGVALPNARSRGETP